MSIPLIVNKVHQASEIARVEHLPRGICQPRNMGLGCLFGLRVHNLESLSLHCVTGTIFAQSTIAVQFFQKHLIIPIARGFIMAHFFLVVEMGPTDQLVHLVMVCHETPIAKAHNDQSIDGAQ